MVAKCLACAEVFALAGEALDPKLAMTLAPPTPSGITVVRTAAQPLDAGDPYRANASTGATLLVVRKWYSSQAIALLCFAVFWNLFLVGWYLMATATSAPWIFFVFPVIHVGAGAWLSYAAITGLINQTKISITGNVLRVREGPVPTGRNREIAIDDIVAIYTTEDVSNRGAKSYVLHALVSGGQSVALGSKFDEAEQPLFVERAIEEHLRLPAHRVPGEYSV